jgi:L-arabinose isomerase
LALSLELYETLAPGLRQSRETWVRKTVLPALAAEADVLYEGAAFRVDQIQQTVDSYRARHVDALLVMLLTYAPSQPVIQPLRQAQLPLVIWNTQELWAVDQAFSVKAMIDNHGVHGTQDLANVLLRANVPFHYVTSHLNDSDGTGELLDFLRAAAAVRQLRSLRIGLLGYPFPGMGDFAVDTTHLAATLGCSWTILPMEEYIGRAVKARARDVSRLVKSYRQEYAVDTGVTPADLEAAARVELGLRGMIHDYNLGAITYQFLAFGDDERTPTVPFVAASRLLAEGIGFGGEGDLVAAAATAFCQQLQTPASFSEIFTVDFAGNALFMSHMGEANVAMARSDRRVALVARPTPITRTRERQMVLVTSFAPGPATLIALTQIEGGRWRFIAARVSIEDYGPLPGFFMPHFKIKVQGDVRQFLTDYALAGGPHHNAICLGDARRRVRLAAAVLGADYREIAEYGR